MTSRQWTASTQYASIAAAAVSGPPMTMACFYKPAAVPASEQQLMVVGTSGSSNNNWRLHVFANDASTYSPAASTRTTATSSAISTGAASGTGWRHFAGTWASATDRHVWLDGTEVDADTTSRAPSAPNITYVGNRPTHDTGPDGHIAYPAVWNVVLSAAEIALLAAGTHPKLIRPDRLVFLPEDWGVDSSEYDYIGERTITLSGTSTSSDDPGVDALPTLSDALAIRDEVAAGTRDAVWACVGDSRTGGFDATNDGWGGNARSQSYPWLMAAGFLAARMRNDSWLGTRGAGDADAFDFDSRLSRTGTWMDSIAWLTGGTLGGGIFYCNVAGTLSFTPGVAFDRVKVFWSGYAGSPQYTVNVDGGSSLGTLAMNANVIGATEYSTSGSSSSVVNVVGGTDGGYIQGALVRTNAEKQISLVNCGWSGAGAVEHSTDTNYYDTLPVLRLLQPDLTIIKLGGGDVLYDRTEAQYKAALRAVIASAMRSGHVMVVACAYFDDGGGAATITEIDNVNTWASEVAAEYGATFFDLTARTNWTSVAAMNSASLLQADEIHWTAAANADFALAIREILDSVLPRASLAINAAMTRSNFY